MASTLTCARCSKPMAQVARSLPQGQAVCHGCRREQREQETEERRTASARRLADRQAAARRRCSYCQQLFTPGDADQRFCSSKCWHSRMTMNPKRTKRRWPKKSTTARGYGASHQAERRRWAAEVKAGRARCSRCGRAIRPDSEWHLDHDDRDRTRYLGPSHARCNLKAAAVKGNRSPKRRQRRRASTSTSSGGATTMRW